MRSHATIIVGARTQYVVKVSLEDLDFLLQWPWTYAVSHPRHGGLVYARRSGARGRPQRHAADAPGHHHRAHGLARPSDKHFVDHDNGDSLDNRRVNDAGRPQLRWLTAKENMANQRGIRAYPAVRAFAPIASDIPF
jgi:hypothetical protein